MALCAVETDKMQGDVYLDDGDHYALAAKFSRDWQGHPDISYPEEWAAMDTQKLRDAAEEYKRWSAANEITPDVIVEPTALELGAAVRRLGLAGE